MIYRIMPAVLFAAIGSVVAADRIAGIAALNRGDHAAALREFRPLAEQGDATARFYLGNMYDHGLGVAEDDQVAASLYREAAEQGDVLAQFYLGLMYADGSGVPEDSRQAYTWIRRAAEQGLADARNRLGHMYFHGEGVHVDHLQAYAWFSIAATQGNRDARRARNNVRKFMTRDEVAEIQRDLEVTYKKGVGIGNAKHDREVVAWYHKAAEKGDVDAKYHLGLIYFDGNGVPENYVQAFCWLELAALQGDVEAGRLRDIVQSRMTRKQVADARKLSRALAAGTRQH
ncbi:MAG: tetratricopeptide repeat protein [Rhodobacteraceae bacterium]|nr:tetratricopeptide repeat protein [Paracoccaceae bacterium]